MNIRYENLMGEAALSFVYWDYLAKAEFANELISRMEAKQIARVELSQKVGVSPAYISRALRGDTNFTIETMTKLAFATGARLKIQLIDTASDSQWKPFASAVYGRQGLQRVTSSGTLNMAAANEQWSRVNEAALA